MNDSDVDSKFSIIVVSVLCIYCYSGYADIFELMAEWYLLGGIFTIMGANI